VDLISIVDNREYVLLDSNLNIVQASSDIQKYADCSETIVLGQDIRQGFPEITGLEATCEAILSGEQKNFVLGGIARNKDQDTAVYFDLHIKSINEQLLVLLEDVTELMLLRQSFLQRVNEAEIALDKLKRFEYCTNKIVASMGDVLFITTPLGIIERINKSTTELFGYKKSELIGKAIDLIIRDDIFNHLQIYNSLLVAKDSVSKIEVIVKNKQHQEIQIEFNCFVVPTEIEGFLNCVYIGRDITARKQAESEIRKSLKKEKELRQLKSGFISMASHEFRNPLSSILLCTEILANNENLELPERKFYLQSIRDAALTMNSLLEDVLILSKAEADKQKLNLTPIDLESFCTQIIQELESIYLDKTIKLDYSLKLSPVYLDQKVLRQILSNLLSNALKYSAKAQTVDLKISSSDDQTAMIIAVCDRGLGIPSKSQKHLFESFYRASNVGNISGTGLGLSIVKKAVDLSKGKIIIDSQINQGTNIFVTLPISNDSSLAE